MAAGRSGLNCDCFLGVFCKLEPKLCWTIIFLRVICGKTAVYSKNHNTLACFSLSVSMFASSLHIAWTRLPNLKKINVEWFFSMQLNFEDTGRFDWFWACSLWSRAIYLSSLNQKLANCDSGSKSSSWTLWYMG